MVITSVATHEDAAAMTQALVAQGLAACVQISTVESCYQWQGEHVQAQEFVLHMKTRANQGDALVDWLHEHHPYEVPEILLLHPQANQAYAAWVGKQCSR